MGMCMLVLVFKNMCMLVLVFKNMWVLVQCILIGYK